MRGALISLLAGAGLAATGCKLDLDDHAFKDAGDTSMRLCRPSTAAPTCLEAEAMQRSDFAWLEANLFDRNCGGDDCHGVTASGQPPSGTLILATGSAFKTLLGKDPTDPNPAPKVRSTFSASHFLVEPGNPDASYLMFLLKAITADQRDPSVPAFVEPPEEAGYMPSGNETLCCQKLDAVRRWIAAGAPP